ncbi:citrate lyase holo-[acyl-carrier protein] synthase [Streptococcus sp. S784/96/1]|uniref:citrate lyase holo-[acyl-carrier protein] synthase n=1 Tax=Streptococcus sp. S784/96/1 TaxID=2653499 RepID=UPI0013868049|nr:citrate lyase holo-[acyl-carrier protein] synthase [Streptococcus sp. S784/96/1]
MSKSIFNGPAITLADMMAAREGRSFRQRSLFERYPGESLLSATMNIPGPVKTSTVLNKAFDDMIAKIEQELASHVIFAKKLEAPTGWEYYLVSNLSPLDLKQHVMALEETSPIGRLFDLDVIELSDGHVHPVSRSDIGLPPRTCYVCSAIAKECSRSRKHSIEEMQEAISNLLTNHL